MLAYYGRLPGECERVSHGCRHNFNKSQGSLSMGTLRKYRCAVNSMICVFSLSLRVAHVCIKRRSLHNLFGIPSASIPLLLFASHRNIFRLRREASGWHLEASGKHLGGIWGASGKHLGASGEHQEAFRKHFECIWRPLEASLNHLEASGRHLGCWTR